MTKIARLMLLVGACLVLGGSPGGRALAQDYLGRDWNDAQDPLKGGLGLHYGKLGGHGLAFRYPLKWYLYTQVAGGIWHTEERRRHNAGFQLDYLLRQDERLRIYLAGGLCYFYDRELVGTVSGQQDWQTSKDWNTGFGVGVEVLQGRRWSYQIELDFVREGESEEIKVSPQLGLYFYW